MSKILFLDIDGVLNKENTSERFNNFTGIDRVLLNKYISWIKGKDIKVVLSSTWRTEQPFMDHLKSLGINWIDVTEKIPGPRGREIASWLDKNNYTHFAILDDMSDMHPVGKGLVQTSGERGLEDKHLRMVESLLEL